MTDEVKIRFNDKANKLSPTDINSLMKKALHFAVHGAKGKDAINRAGVDLIEEMGERANETTRKILNDAYHYRSSLFNNADDDLVADFEKTLIRPLYALSKAKTPELADQIGQLCASVYLKNLRLVVDPLDTRRRITDYSKIRAREAVKALLEGLSPEIKAILIPTSDKLGKLQAEVREYYFTDEHAAALSSDGQAPQKDASGKIMAPPPILPKNIGNGPLTRSFARDMARADGAAAQERNPVPREGNTWKRQPD